MTPQEKALDLARECGFDISLHDDGRTILTKEVLSSLPPLGVVMDKDFTEMTVITVNNQVKNMRIGILTNKGANLFFETKYVVEDLAKELGSEEAAYEAIRAAALKIHDECGEVH